jgi:hypothetical protein
MRNQMSSYHHQMMMGHLTFEQQHEQEEQMMMSNPWVSYNNHNPFQSHAFEGDGAGFRAQPVNRSNRKMCTAYMRHSNMNNNLRNLNAFDMESRMRNMSVSSEDPSSPMASPKCNNQPNKVCKLCRSNRETPEVYMSHALHDENGKVACPVLR